MQLPLQLSYYVRKPEYLDFKLKFYVLKISHLKSTIKYFKYFVLQDTVLIIYLCNVK